MLLNIIPETTWNEGGGEGGEERGGEKWKALQKYISFLSKDLLQWTSKISI